MIFSFFAEQPLLMLGKPRLKKPDGSFYFTKQEQVDSRLQVKTDIPQLFRAWFRYTHTCRASISGQYRLYTQMVNDTGQPQDAIPVDFRLEIIGADLVYVRDAQRDARLPEFLPPGGWTDPGPLPDPRRGGIRYGAAPIGFFDQYSPFYPRWDAHYNVRMRMVDYFVGNFFGGSMPDELNPLLIPYFFPGPSTPASVTFRKVGVAAVFASWTGLMPMVLSFGLQSSFFDPASREVYPSYFLGGSMDGFRPFELGWRGDIAPLSEDQRARANATVSLKARGAEIPLTWSFFPIPLTNIEGSDVQGSVNLSVEWKEDKKRPL